MHACLGKLSSTASVLQVSHGPCLWEGIQEHKREGRFLIILWPRTNGPEEGSHLAVGFYVYSTYTDLCLFSCDLSLFLVENLHKNCEPNAMFLLNMLDSISTST